MKIVLCTSNKHKLQEIKQLLPQFEIVSLPEVFPNLPEPVEDGNTFEANAIKKVEYLNHPEMIFLADDSGLEVEALGGRPGVLSARYRGAVEKESSAALTSLDQCRLLLEEMQNKTNRRARFVCVMALKWPDGIIETFEGVVDGQIAPSLQGENGFGYDPIFIPEGYEDTFGALPLQVKQSISHRVRALELLKDRLTFQRT